MTARRVIASFATWAVATFLVTLLVVVAAAPALQARGLVVLSGSMRPALQVGDVTVNESIRASSARPGDILTFSDPQRPGRLLTHRAQLVERQGGRMRVLTRGDANSASEEWRIAADGRVGRVALRVPLLGYVLAAMGHPLGNLGFIVLPALALAALALRRIWRAPEPEAAPDAPLLDLPLPAVWGLAPAQTPTHPYLAGRHHEMAAE